MWLTTSKKMKQNDSQSADLMDEIGDSHASSATQTPLRKDAFDISDTEKKKIIEGHFFKIMETLGLDMNDDSLKHISVNSTCEHHFLPIVGQAHVAYISTGNVIGLSKINRIVDYYARRPQVQERLTMQIMEELKKALQTDSVAVVIEAQHLCVTSRGITDRTSTTVTVEYSGEFCEESTKAEFLKYIGDGIK